MVNSYWWGSNTAESKGIRWMMWSRLSVPKAQGGMGFRQLHGFNLAMLGKQAWKLLTMPESLMTRLLKAKYFPSCSFLHA